jgi:hypothetical protein
MLWVYGQPYAVVVSVDEKSQIQALDRTQPVFRRNGGSAQPSRTITKATVRRPCSPRSVCSMARSSAAVWRAIAIRSSSASSRPSSDPCRPAKCPGSTPSKASSPGSLGRAANGASFARLTTSKARSPATSPPPAGNQALRPQRDRKNHPGQAHAEPSVSISARVLPTVSILFTCRSCLR